MNIQKVLFPTDFSHYNDAALKLASTLAAESGATLYIVHVDEMRDITAAMGEAGFLMSATSEERTEVIEQLEKVRPTVPTVKFERHYLKGSPVVEILTFAADENIDLIVMASHGRTGIPRLLMGSIAEGVMRKAQCPVLVVKQPSGERKSRENSRDVENRSQAAAAVTNKRMRKQRVHSESPVLHGTHAISGNTIHFN